MNPRVSQEQLTQFKTYFDQHNDNIVSYSVVDKKEILDYFDLDRKVVSDIDLNKMISDQYIIEIGDTDSAGSEEILANLKAINGVSGIDKIEDRGQNVVMSGHASISTSALILIFILVLSIIYLGLSLDFNRNRQSLLSLINKGATQSYLMSTYQKKGLFLSIKAWFGGIILFFTSFYLLRFNSYTDLNIFDLKFLGIVGLVPLALIIFITSFVIYTKIMTLIRE